MKCFISEGDLGGTSPHFVSVSDLIEKVIHSHIDLETYRPVHRLTCTCNGQFQEGLDCRFSHKSSPECSEEGENTLEGFTEISFL